jgi:putative hydrolase of the HAD superfamily
LGLRAVVFDYGMVLTGQPDPKAHASLLRITGLPLDRFENFYWAHRHDYDLGVLTGIAFWEKFIADAGLSLEPGLAEELNLWDSQMWTAQNPVMLAWHEQLKERGLRTAILSNMGDSVLANIEREFAWIQDFDVLVWSYQLHMAKPDPEIYRHVLKELGTLPEETLFLDDKLVNIQAARALGIRAIHFSTVEQLRADLIVAGLASQLPLP